MTGIDNAPDMLARARRDFPGIAWEEGDLGAWQPGERYGLVFSNAALQWVPHHAALFPHLLGQAAEGGALAVQMPGNFDAPAHRLMRELAASKAWRDSFPAPVREWHVHDLPDYYDIVAPHAARLDLWATEYQHILDGPRRSRSGTRGPACARSWTSCPARRAGAVRGRLHRAAGGGVPARADGR